MNNEIYTVELLEELETYRDLDERIRKYHINQEVVCLEHTQKVRANYLYEVDIDGVVYEYSRWVIQGFYPMDNKWYVRLKEYSFGPYGREFKCSLVVLEKRFYTSLDSMVSSIRFIQNSIRANEAG